MEIGNSGRMHLRFNDEQFEEIDCFTDSARNREDPNKNYFNSIPTPFKCWYKYLESQVAADRGCKMDVYTKMNEGYRAWGALKSALRNRGLGISAKKCLYEGVIAPTALYGAEA